MARTKVPGALKLRTPEAKAACERLRIQHILNQPCSLMDDISRYYDDLDFSPDLDFMLEEIPEGVNIRALTQYVPPSKAYLLCRMMQVKKALKEMRNILKQVENQSGNSLMISN